MQTLSEKAEFLCNKSKSSIFIVPACRADIPTSGTPGLEKRRSLSSFALEGVSSWIPGKPNPPDMKSAEFDLRCCQQTCRTAKHAD